MQFDITQAYGVAKAQHGGTEDESTRAVDHAVGEMIEQIRQSREITLEDFAIRTRIPKAMLRSIEAGSERPDAADLLAIAKALGVEVSSFFILL